jgi:hypothetical protein
MQVNGHGLYRRLESGEPIPTHTRRMGGVANISRQTVSVVEPAVNI